MIRVRLPAATSLPLFASNSPVVSLNLRRLSAYVLSATAADAIGNVYDHDDKDNGRRTKAGKPVRWKIMALYSLYLVMEWLVLYVLIV